MGSLPRIEYAEISGGMKNLMILTYYYPHWTGLTAYAQRLAEGLVRKGHEVTVLTSRFSRDLPLREVHNGVTVVRLPMLARLSRGVIMPTFPFVANRLIRQHDVVQVHTPMLETFLVGLLGRLAGKRLLITHHGDLVMPDGVFEQSVEKAVVWLMTQGATLAERMSVHSKDYADHSKFLSPFAHKMHYIYPPVEMPIPEPEAVESLKRELGLADEYVVGFAGRFVEEKGFDYLLKAIPFVREQIPNAKFVYAGERAVYEDFYDRWKHLVEGNHDSVVMMGLIRERERLASFYAMCDLFALPSRTDCFPSVQIESMLCGTPVVATDIPGAREVVKVTGMGRLVAPGDERALADGIVDVLRNPRRYHRTREQIGRIFDLDKCVDEYEQVLRNLMTTSASRAQTAELPSPSRGESPRSPLERSSR